MITQTQGQIYLSDQRGCTEKSGFRSLHTFNYGSFFHEYKVAFGGIFALNENTLAAGKSESLHPEEGTEILLIPVAGGIEFKNPVGFQDYLVPGQLQVVRPDHRGPYEIINPYGLETIHYIQIILRSRAVSPAAEDRSFDPDHKNCLAELYSGKDSQVSIGKYTGREGGCYTMKNKENGVFVFAIQGALEVQERLLQPKDGLALWDVMEIGFEALSNDAILLFIETPLKD